MLTYQDLLLPYKFKKNKGKTYSKCPFCVNGILIISSNTFFCTKCKFSGNEQDLLRKFNINATAELIPKPSSNDCNLPPQIKINNPDRPIFLVFELELFDHLTNKFPKLNLILNPTASMKEIQNKILYICSQKTEYANMFFSIAKILKILDYNALLNCNTEEDLKQLILKSNFYDPYPIYGYIISEDKKIVDYANQLKYTAFLAKAVSPSIIEENSNVFFLYKTATLHEIAKVINPLFPKTQNIFLLNAKNISTVSFTDIISEKRHFTIQLKKIVYKQYKNLIENSQLLKKIPSNIFEQTMNEFYSCEKLIDKVDFNLFLNLILDKYDFLIRNIP